MPSPVARPLAVAITPLETRREVVLHVAQQAERLGYTAFHLAEGWGYDAAVLLTEIAGRTHRIRLSTGVLNIWGRSPAQIAMMATSLDEASHGRFTLGLGAGSPALAEGLHGRAFTAPVATLATVVGQVRALLAGERSTPTGNAAGLRLAVRPRRHVPITLAALGPAAVRLAGAAADGWCPFLLPRSVLKQTAEQLATAAAAAGRPTPRILPGLPVAIATDPERARAQAAWWVARYLTGMGPLYPRTLRRAGLATEADAVLRANPTRATADVPPQAAVLLDELTVWGDPGSARDLLGTWYADGAEEPSIVLPPGVPVVEIDLALQALRPT